MLIQPYVENAINHGLRYLPGGNGRLLLTFRQEGDMLICSIDDNGIGIEKAKTKTPGDHKSMGMEINRQRVETINAMYRTDIRVAVLDKKQQDREDSGTLVVLTMPVQINE